MAEPLLLSEREQAAGWAFDIHLDEGPEADPHARITLHLSWADYNLWSASGADEPSAVALAVIRYLIGRGSISELRDQFDASICRRLYPDADEVIPTLIASRPGC